MGSLSRSHQCSVPAQQCPLSSCTMTVLLPTQHMHAHGRRCKYMRTHCEQ